MAAIAMTTGYPFDGQAVGESQWTAVARRWFGDGILRGELNAFNAFGDSSGLQVKVQSGRGWFHGHFGEEPNQITVPVSTPHPSNFRIDRVVIRVNWVANRIEFDMVTGTASPSPSAPALTRTGTVWEFSLATVTVSPGASTISAANVVDERPNAAVCGYAYSPYPTQTCTAALRPTNFEVGGLIYQTDTQSVFVNTGTFATPVWTQLTTASISFGTPAFVLGTAYAPGAAATAVRTDATLALFDATAPVNQAIGDVAAAGAINFAARAGHKHGMPSFASPAALAIGDTLLDGVLPSVPHSDHRHAMPGWGTPSALVLGIPNSAGVALTIPHSDHTHGLPAAGTPVTLAFGDTPDMGTGTAISLATHRHGMPAATNALATVNHDVTPATLGNNNARTALYTATVGAGLLGTDRLLHLLAFGEYTNDTGVDRTLRIEVLYGGGVFFDETITIAASASVRGFELEAWISAFGAANAQRGSGRLTINTQKSGPNCAVAYHRAFVAAGVAVDSSAAQNLAIYATHSMNSLTLTMTLEAVHVALWG